MWMLASQANYQDSLQNLKNDELPPGHLFHSSEQEECECHGDVERWTQSPASTAWDPSAQIHTVTGLFQLLSNIF